MPQGSSAVVIVVFVAFGVLALCVVLSLCVLMSDWFSTVLRLFKRAFNYIRGARYGAKYDESDDITDDISDNASDDISDDASQVLAMLDMPTVVIDANNDVIRASSEAYLLGVVSDDSLCQPRVLQAVNSVRASGGFERFSLVTSTPERYVSITANPQESTTVSRPNWLTVTAGSIGGGIVVVIIEDTSAAHRFAQTRDDFISNVSEQLMRSTRNLTQLTNCLLYTSDAADE